MPGWQPSAGGPGSPHFLGQSFQPTARGPPPEISPEPLGNTQSQSSLGGGPQMTKNWHLSNRLVFTYGLGQT